MKAVRPPILQTGAIVHSAIPPRRRDNGLPLPRTKKIVYRSIGSPRKAEKTSTGSCPSPKRQPIDITTPGLGLTVTGWGFASPS